MTQAICQAGEDLRGHWVDGVHVGQYILSVGQCISQESQQPHCSSQAATQQGPAFYFLVHI